MSQIFVDPTRSVLSMRGTDVRAFLQPLLTNSVDRLTPSEGLYAALLTPQGKYLSDLFFYGVKDVIYADIPKQRAGTLLARLSMYKLRRDVEIILEDTLAVFQATEQPRPVDVLVCTPDPRHQDLGYRGVTQQTNLESNVDTEHLIRLGIPLDTVDLRPDNSYILEMGFERLNGVDFKKGCYVGQEVTARMRHKTVLKKGLARLTFQTPLPHNINDISTAEGKVVGQVGSRNSHMALALIKKDSANNPLFVADIPVNVAEIFEEI